MKTTASDRRWERWRRLDAEQLARAGGNDGERIQRADAAVEAAQERAHEDNEARRIGLI